MCRKKRGVTHQGEGYHIHISHLSPKKAQVSIYILIGIILLIGVLVYIIITSEKIDPVDATQSMQQRISTVSIEQSLDVYVGECIANSLEPLLQQLAIGGGTLKRTDQTILYNREEYRVLCEQDGISKDCVQIPLLRQSMEHELAQALSEILPSCVTVTPFSQMGYDVVHQSVQQVSVMIRDDTIDIAVRMPTTLTYDGATVTKDQFALLYRSPFGEVYSTVQLILNSHLIAGDFDPTQFMMHEQMVYRIAKQKPYPNIVYKVRRERQNQQTYTFLFALQGKDRASDPGQVVSTTNPHQCCQNPRDGSYFANVKSCNEHDMIVSGACYGSEQSDILYVDATSAASYQRMLNSHDTNECLGERCSVCGTKKHGESWCAYESVLFSRSDSGGLAYVGSRSFRHSCLHGEVFIEPARDFREEICVESANGQLAQIRTNRWNTCASCTNQGCCESATHDCSWSEWLSTEQKCHPIVPPGFRFWEGAGMNVCAQATTSLRCEGFSCPNKWVDDTSLYCSYMGDCGNYRNIADVITQDGFFNTDPTDIPRSYIYNPDNYNKDPRALGLAVPKLALDVPTYNPNDVTYPDPAAQLPLLTSAAFSYLDDMSKITPGDFLNPFKKPRIEILDFAFCANWQAPVTQTSCSQCVENGFCSEYRCKSLGQTCQYVERNGVGVCLEQEPQTQTVAITKISSNTSTVTLGSLTAFENTIYGASLSPTLFAGDMVSFSFETSVPTKCKMSYAPNMSFVRLPGVWVGTGAFATSHSVQLRSPPPIQIPQQLYNAFDIQSVKEVATMAYSLERVFDQQVQKYDSHLNRYKEMTGIDVVAIARPYVKLASTVMSLYSQRLNATFEFLEFMLGEFEVGQYYLFLNCQDEYGTQSVDYFVTFKLSQSPSNTPPTVITQSITSQQTSSYNLTQVALYLDEWATCRYDVLNTSYDAMRYSLRCPLSQYDRSPVAHGTYACGATLNVTQLQDENPALNVTHAFVLCKDNPAKRKLIEFRVYDESRFTQKYGSATFIPDTVAQNADDRYLAFEGATIIAVDTLLTRNSVFTNAAQLNLELYTDDAYTCEEQTMQQPFSCMLSDAANIDRGFYVCQTTIPSQENVSILCGLNPGPQFTMLDPFVIDLE
jgi:hypothetical protein